MLTWMNITFSTYIIDLMVMLPEIVELTESENYRVCAMITEPNHERNVTLTFSVVPTGVFSGILVIATPDLTF